VKLTNPSNKPLKTPDKPNSKLNSILKPSLLKSPPKENPSQLPDKMLKDNSLKTNKPLTSKRRERKMPPQNSTLPLLVKNKRKVNVTPSEPNTPKTVNTDNKKSPSSDKLKRSLLPNCQESRFISKRDHPHEFNDINFIFSFAKIQKYLNNYYNLHLKILNPH
jgi:hypothetical protein